MKYLIIISIAFFSLACASQNVQQKSKNLSLEEKIKSGQPVYIKDQIFEDEIDFTTFLRKNLVGVNIYQSDIYASITFIDCVFNQPVTAYSQTENTTDLVTFHSNVSFVGCKFNSTVNFRGSNFYGRLDFSKSKFFDNVSFEEITSYQNAYFSDGYFDKELKFQNSFFIQKANFMNTQFNENISFQNTVFNAEAQFSVCKFYGYADFSLIDCRDNIFFNYAQFHDRAALSNAKFQGDVMFTSTLNKYTRFSKSKFFGKAVFDKSEVSEMMDFENCFFLMSKPNLDFISSEKLNID